MPPVSATATTTTPMNSESARRRSGARGCRGRPRRCRAGSPARRPPARPAAPAARRGTARSGVRRDRAARRWPPARAATKTTSPITRAAVLGEIGQNSASRRAGRGGAAWPTSAARRRCVGSSRPQGMPDARVDQAVEQVDDEVDQHDDAGDQQQAALDHRIVAAEDRIRPSTCRRRARRRSSRSGWRRPSARRPAGRSW